MSRARDKRRKLRRLDPAYYRSMTPVVNRPSLTEQLERLRRLRREG